MVRNFKSIVVFFITFIFWANTIGLYAQDVAAPAIPRIQLSQSFTPPLLKGVRVHPENPFLFSFVLDKGAGSLEEKQVKEVASRLIRYFMTGLTVPEKDWWVNLSPYEKDRIMPSRFGLTEMGRDLLEDDRLLKQLTASLMYPEEGLGKTFWQRVYEEASRKYGTTDIPVNTFHKIWIMPEKAVVYENAKTGTAYIVETKLKVMLESDYLALTQRAEIGQTEAAQEENPLATRMMREVIIPALTEEVNYHRNFARLRQIYHSLILAVWYKKKIKAGLLARIYADKNKVAGINIDDPRAKEKIYQEYLQLFKRGVYNYIKEETDPVSRQVIPKRYFSGGEIFEDLDRAMSYSTDEPRDSGENKIEITADLRETQSLPRDALNRQIALTRELLNGIRQGTLPRIINVGDKHGDKRDLEEVLKDVRAAIVSREKLEVEVHGDVFDRGRNTARNLEILKSFMKAAQENPNIKVRLYLGNHEALILKAVLGRDRESVERWIRPDTTSPEGSTTLEEFEKKAVYKGRLSPLRDAQGNRSAIKAIKNLQIQYVLNRDNPLSKLTALADFIIKHFDVAGIDSWGRLNRHTIIPLDDQKKPKYTVDDVLDKQAEWEQLRKANDLEGIIRFLNDNDTQENRFFSEYGWGSVAESIQDEEGNYDFGKAVQYIVKIGGRHAVSGVVFGHEGAPYNVDGIILGVDTRDYSPYNQEPAHAAMSPEGLFFPADKNNRLSSREGLIKNLQQRFSVLRKLKRTSDALAYVQTADSAQRTFGQQDSLAQKGGVDLTVTADNLEVPNSEEAIQFNIDVNQLERLKRAAGFFPVIVDMQPVTSLSQFWGKAR